MKLLAAARRDILAATRASGRPPDSVYTEKKMLEILRLVMRLRKCTRRQAQYLVPSMTAASPVSAPVKEPGLELLDGKLIRAVLFVKNSSRARRVLEYLALRGRAATKPLLRTVLGCESKKNHALLNELMALGLIKRYSGHNEDGHFVVWNEITPFGRLVLRITESMKEGD